MKQTNHNVNLTAGTPVRVVATADLEPDGQKGLYGGSVEQDGRLIIRWPDCVPAGGGNLSVIARDYQEYIGRTLIPVSGALEAAGFDVTLVPGTNPFRRTPTLTRERVCGVNLTFAGLTVTTDQYGAQPWFEPAYQTLIEAEDRQRAREQKRAAGDTHLILEFFTQNTPIYDEPGQPWQNVVSLSGEQNPQWFRALVLEVLADNLVPVVAFDGDNGQSPVNGYPNALRQLPVLVDLLRDVAGNVLFARLWDGVWYGSTPDQIAAFGRAFRSLLPDGNLAIEFATGLCHLGGGKVDYVPGGKMADYDVILGEFDLPVNTDATWQVLARMVSHYLRPPDQPAGDDPAAEYYLAGPNNRGLPYFYVMFEEGEYQWVRNQIDQPGLVGVGDYLRGCGAARVCLPRS